MRYDTSIYLLIMDDTKNVQEEQEVVDGEIVEEPQVSPDVTTSDQSQVLLSLEEMIKSYIASLDRLSEEKRKLAEMLADGFNNDAAFKEASDKVKEANKAKAVARQQVMGRQGMIESANKLKSISAEIKEKQLSLSDYLLEYQRMANGVNEIEGYDGEVREIVHIARLVKKLSSKK